jgi:hypothetical protein
LLVSIGFFASGIACWGYIYLEIRVSTDSGQSRANGEVRVFWSRMLSQRLTSFEIDDEPAIESSFLTASFAVNQVDADC